MMRYKMALASLVILAVCTSAFSASRPEYGGTLRIGYSPWGLLEERSTEQELVLDLVSEPLWMQSRNLLRSVAETPSDTASHLVLRFKEKVAFHDGTVLSDTILQEFLKDYALPADYHSWVFSGLPERPSALSRDPGMAPVEDGTVTLSMEMIPSLMEPGFELLRPVSGSLQTELVGTGPFRLVSADGSSTYLEANENHWAGRPFLDSIVLTEYENAEKCVLPLMSGETDAVWIYEGFFELQETNVKSFRSGKLKEREFIWIIGMNSRSPATAGPSFMTDSSRRQAFVHALRLEEMTGALLQNSNYVGAYIPDAIFMPPASRFDPGNRDAVEPLTHDSNQSPVRIVYPDRIRPATVIARRMQAVLIELGYQPELFAVSEAELQHRLDLQQFDLIIGALCPHTSDPRVNLASFYSNHVADGPFSLPDSDEQNAAQLFDALYHDGSMDTAAELEALILSSATVVPVLRTRAGLWLWVADDYKLPDHLPGDLSDLWFIGSE